ncbi:hypothetical protein ABIC78_004302 [Novosphingobium sp. 1529]|nr:hypothetical protein [Novosphingobium sp. BK256]MBB3376922.1 hypothetical protein [Novosphingobium sp. BK280]MBB3381292.1 hypothetical protein [Novosphingobium sp. BK258]MBB3422983.1 hypothetical protein [Novosphingobium sp. BK267]MBB3451685.1 hypothetical protein [Novosphingobium sp. BK352]MBB3480190.1 hypothetical protein [Novosphingobium sp. BK369]MBB3503506.1 hypothetical protein [Novosphingobium sp. BK336]MBB3539250.1 hypothetical protein [Novosphingobium sp. BK486]MBB3558647.1 hypo
MAPPSLHVLTEAEKNDLLLAQYETIERMAGRISELEALVGKPRKTSKNSHIPPSKDDFGKGRGRSGKAKGGSAHRAKAVRGEVCLTKPVLTVISRKVARPDLLGIFHSNASILAKNKHVSHSGRLIAIRFSVINFQKLYQNQTFRGLRTIPYR